MSNRKKIHKNSVRKTWVFFPQGISDQKKHTPELTKRVDGWTNPFETFFWSSNWIISPILGVKIPTKMFETTTQQG